MSIAGSQASKFYEQVACDEKVFTFTEDGELLVFPIRENEVVPFWSSKKRLQKIQKEHPKYTNYSISEIALKDFLGETLTILESEEIRVGVNWAGKSLTGYDLEVKDLKRNIGYWLEKQGDNG
jgi:hypothetical protein